VGKNPGKKCRITFAEESSALLQLKKDRKKVPQMQFKIKRSRMVCGTSIPALKNITFSSDCRLLGEMPTQMAT